MADTATIEFAPWGRVVEVVRGRTALDATREADVPVASVCGGAGTCGRCRVQVVGGQAPVPTEADRRVLSRVQLEAGERLACRIHVEGPLRIAVPRGSLLMHQRLQTEGPGREVVLDPAVRAQRVSVPRPSLDDVRADLERVEAAALAGHLEAVPAVVRQLTPALRASEWQVELLLRGRDLVGVLPPGRPSLGYAVDLGTTKIAGYLIDLNSGAELATQGVANPQAHFGADVITRLAHAARTEDGAAILAQVVRHALDRLLGSLCEAAGADRSQVADACVVGNTAMHHLLLELPTRQLSRAPFVPALAAAVDVPARDLGIEAAPDAHVHLLPNVAGYVGGDAVAMMLGLDLDRVEVVKIAVDIGTNTEIALRRPEVEHLTVVSCASGPAFEGGHISHGMSAASGAIDRVTFDDQARPSVHTVDDAPPLGICGSGILDAVAGMRRSGLIGAGGRLRKGAANVRRGDHDQEVVLVPAARSGTAQDIVVTQADIGEIQLAKGAIAAGMEILLEATRTAPQAVEEVVLAGAFGTFLDLDSALAVGLLPRLPNAAYVQVGNAAGVGARAALRSLGERARARRIAASAEYIELTTRPEFRRRFAHAMRFGPPPALIPGSSRADDGQEGRPSTNAIAG